MDDQLFPMTQPPMSADQLWALLAHLLLDPQLFADARDRLAPGHFCQPGECVLRIVWRTALDIADRFSAGVLVDNLAQARNLMATEALAYADGRPEECSPDHRATLEYFFRWLYEEYQPEENHAGYGHGLLLQFLRERRVVYPLIRAVQGAGVQAITNLPEMIAILGQREEAIVGLGGGARRMADEWDQFLVRLAAHRGHTLIGLRTGMPLLDSRTLGLRDLIALGAMPGAGKTALALQLGVNVLAHNPDAVLLFLSLEMSPDALYTRLVCNRAGLDWKTVTLGSPSLRGHASGPWLTPQDQGRLDQAYAALHGGGLTGRVLVLDQKALGADATASTVLAHLARLKAEAGAARALVVVDYLQLLPVPEGVVDLDADRARVQFLKDLLAGTRTAANPGGDCVLAISEIRKPSGKQRWEGRLADLMGSARLPYAVDAAFTLRQMDGHPDLFAYDWSAAGVPHASPAAFEEAGVAPVKLELLKGRDGFQQGSIMLAFQHRLSRFLEMGSGAASHSSSCIHVPNQGGPPAGGSLPPIDPNLMFHQ